MLPSRAPGGNRGPAWPSAAIVLLFPRVGRNGGGYGTAQARGGRGAGEPADRSAAGMAGARPAAARRQAAAVRSLGPAGERADGARLHQPWLGRALVHQSAEARLAGLPIDRERPRAGDAALTRALETAMNEETF